jgi:hypothetical protein
LLAPIGRGVKAHHFGGCDSHLSEAVWNDEKFPRSHLGGRTIDDRTQFEARSARHGIRVLVATALATMVAAVGAAAGDARQDTSAAEARSAASCAGAVSWRNAATVLGRQATIRGPVAGAVFAASSNGSPTFLNLGVDYPNRRRFTVVIWVENRARFGAPERRYRGHTICVRGLVRSYQGLPQIHASSPSQIAIAR